MDIGCILPIPCDEADATIGATHLRSRTTSLVDLVRLYLDRFVTCSTTEPALRSQAVLVSRNSNLKDLLIQRRSSLPRKAIRTYFRVLFSSSGSFISFPSPDSISLPRDLTPCCVSLRRTRLLGSDYYTSAPFFLRQFLPLSSFLDCRPQPVQCVPFGGRLMLSLRRRPP